MVNWEFYLNIVVAIFLFGFIFFSIQRGWIDPEKFRFGKKKTEEEKKTETEKLEEAIYKDWKR